jgi:cellulose synthase/poly-beta-1,6-N-acetylglucosamine synthase-like glycosyltransferase
MLTHLGPWGIVTLVMGAFVALFDFQNLLSWRKKLVLSPLESGITDFTVVIPLFGDPRYFEHRERLEHLKERILVAVEVSSERMELFAGELEAEGWKVFRAVIPVPSPPKLLLAALEADAVETTYAMRLDADSLVGHDLPNAMAAVQADGADLCSVKVLVQNRSLNACTRFQALEYDMAMLARHYRPWLISGAGVVARTSMLREILRRHSMSPIGEDIEMGRVAFAGKLRIRHLDIVIKTDAPETWRALFRQRRLWWAGNFRHSFVNFDRNLVQLPWWSLYNLAILWMTIHLHPWSYASVVLHPSGSFVGLAALVVVVAAVTTLVSNWQVRTPLMAVFPFYAMLQSTMIVSVGAFWYLRLLAKSRNFGRYRFGLRRCKLVLPARTIPAEWLERWSIEPRPPRLRPDPSGRPTAVRTVAQPLTVALALTGFVYARRRARRH